jgi:branched-chain amino acid transport system ATP-binding protein
MTAGAGDGPAPPHGRTGPASDGPGPASRRSGRPGDRATAGAPGGVPLLEARDVQKFYGSVCALAGVSLTVHTGEFVSIIGPNGAGKTTFVNVLTGVAAPTRGTVRFKGRDIGGLGAGRLAHLGMARSFQLVTIFPGLTVEETIAVAVVSRLHRARRLLSRLAGDREVRTRVREVAELFTLGDRLGQPARTLPQGDKKLLDVASAFALHPEIILLDEPTSGVSTADKHAIMDVLVAAARRIGIRAILQVEHDMDIVFGYSDRIVALHQGKVLADTTPDGIRADPEVVATVVGRPPERRG